MDWKRDKAEDTTTNWLQHLPKTHGKRKVVIASLAFQKTWAQVCCLLERLEEEYKRMEDWCCATGKPDSSAQMVLVTSMIRKHLEQKEFFLKACVNKGNRRYLLPVHREERLDNGKAGSRPRRACCRKQQMDQCLQYLSFERRATKLTEPKSEFKIWESFTCRCTTPPAQASASSRSC
ncbi:triple functional domain protein-like [Corythoichthys intestinalis]|uniref:triple functional domain protein-like n=1 Tax=Corythoichthys intestinalis TaxID=161448 RepID=UPI0025A586E4|nr:triple functional domain protein-like [Corythoichthys intestinalis]